MGEEVYFKESGNYCNREPMLTERPTNFSELGKKGFPFTEQ